MTDTSGPTGRARDARPIRHAAEEAVRTLIAWAHEDPEREGLRDIPRLRTSCNRAAWRWSSRRRTTA